jgi:catechol 2,3-dioxygenase-like lactoylglutathione lyase family enzyme
MAKRPRPAMRVADLARSVAFYRDQIGFTLAGPRASVSVPPKTGG